MRHFKGEQSAGFPASTYVFYGEDEFLLYEACLELKGQYDKGHGDMSFVSFDFLDPDIASTFAQIIDEAETEPFFGMGDKTIVVRNFQKAIAGKKKGEAEEGDGQDGDEKAKPSGKKKGAARVDGPKAIVARLNAYAANPTPTTKLFVFCQGKDASFFERGKSAKAIPVAVDDLDKWTARLAASRGVKLTAEAISYLRTAVNGNTGMLYSEIEKFAVAFEKGRTLDVGDIKGLVYTDPESNAFLLGDALLKRDKKAAFGQALLMAKNKDPLPQVAGGLRYKLFGYRQGTNDEAARLHEMDVASKTGGADPLVAFILESLYRNEE